MNRLPRSTRMLACLVLAAFAAVIIVQTRQRQIWRADRADAHAAAPRPHIVSLVPSVTETLFMLGLGDHVVARSDYCDFPEVVTNRPAIGSLGHVNVEAIARLKPDFVILSDAQAQSKVHDALARLRINHLGVPANALADIYQSVWELAERFDAQDRARLWLEHMDALNRRVAAQAPSRTPRMLVCAGRDPDAFSRIYISGKNNFYAGIIEQVGGVNAYSGPLPYPMVSLEGIVQMNPDIIIDILVDASREEVINALEQWGRLLRVNAVRTGSVHILTDAWAARPGPRIDRLIQTLAGHVSEWDARNDH